MGCGGNRPLPCAYNETTGHSRWRGDTGACECSGMYPEPRGPESRYWLPWECITCLLLLLVLSGTSAFTRKAVAGERPPPQATRGVAGEVAGLGG